MGNRAYQYTFKRDEKGNLSTTGTYTEPSLTKATFKYPEQGRFSFGVASVLPLGATKPVGKRIKEVDYTGKNICTHEVFAKHMKEECGRVKSLKGKCLPWYVDPRPPDELWMEDPVTKMKGAGGAKGQRLIECGVLTIANMKSHDDNQLLTLVSRCEGVSLSKLTEWRNCDASAG